LSAEGHGTVGHGCAKAGLKGAVDEKKFLALCEGRNPETGDRLTERLNSVHIVDGKLTANRRIFGDFAISPPKRVLILACATMTGSRLFISAGSEIAIIELERFAETRVRVAKQNGERGIESSDHEERKARDIDWTFSLESLQR
jgi:hypothetical protein